MNASPPAPSAASAHVVVVGAGGLGCPAAWALAEAGVGRLTLIDPDVVEPSNLPRQVLYEPADVGRPKAVVAAERLARFGGRVDGLHARLDDANEARVLAGAGVLVDATDGAATKDWLNALAVRHGLPLVHAAAIRAEGRLLEVPAGGRPCLACLFGRLTEDPGQACADHGVWGGVVGAVGFLAASAALRRLAQPRASSPGYVVLDVEGGRAFTLGAEAAAECPVCGPRARRDPEPYPGRALCDASDGPGSGFAHDARRGPQAPNAGPPPEVLDLVGESCPLNLLRARRAVESLGPGRTLEIRLGAEGAASVPDGLRALGHEVLDRASRGDGLRLLVRRGAARPSDAPLGRDELVRFARQVVLPEVGEVGQRRLLAGEVGVRGTGPVAETACVYLRAAGVGRVRRGEAPGGAEAEIVVPVVAPERVLLSVGPDGAGRLGVVRAPHGAAACDRGAAALDVPAPIARALGALLADAVCRQLVFAGGQVEPPQVVLGADGTIASRRSFPVPS